MQTALSTVSPSPRPLDETNAVAVVIPVYNGERYLEECIRSVLAQTHTAAEIVVVDDGSSDTSAAIAASFPEVTVLSQRNSGVAISRNRGVEATNSPWIAFLDADDFWMPDKLERQLETAERDGADVCFVGTRMLYSSPPTEESRFGEVALPPASSIVAKQLKLGVTFTPSCALVRRDAFRRTEGFDPASSPAEDWDFWLRLATSGAKFASCRVPLVGYRNHAENTSKDGTRMYQASLRIFEQRIAPGVAALWRPFYRWRIKSRLWASYARVNRDGGHPHIRLMLASLVSNPFGEWGRYRAMLHMILREMRLLRQPERGHGR